MIETFKERCAGRGLDARRVSLHLPGEKLALPRLEESTSAA